jgi:DnaK suppressor protein
MPLNRRDIIQLASAIEERRDALREEIRRAVARGREETYAELTGATHDRGEEALADLVADLGNAEVTRDLEELRALEAALRRIADGGFGLCADCGAGIPLERLRVQPAAERCLECQARHEKTYRAA